VKVRHFSELASLRQTLLQAAREAAAEAAREREVAARERLESELFARSVGQVIPLRKGATSALARAQPEPVPRQRQRDEAAVLVESISDEFDVESLLDTDEDLSFRRRGISAEVVRKLRRGVWVIQAQIDLHGLRRDAAREHLGHFLREAVREGLRCVRVIHGKGNGSPGREPVLKGKVKSWLVQKAEVLAFAQARASDGGHGALLVLLRPVAATPAHRQPADAEAKLAARRRSR